jgi:outer membrane protein insertion porin family
LTPCDHAGIARPDFLNVRTLLASACLLACLFAPLAPFAHGQAQPPVDDEEELDEEALDEELDAEEEADEEAPPQLGTNPYVQEEDADEAVEVVGACQGRRIIRIMVEGMQRVTAEDILAGMRLGRDMPCSDVEVTRDARALWELGFFDDIVIEAEPVGAGVVLVVRVRERPEIRHIVFEGNDEVDDDDLTEEITLRERQILSASEVRAQVAKIRDHYASEGFFLARITHEVLRVDGDTNEVDVVFRIDEGPEVKVRRITIVGNDNISTSDLHGIMATGETGFFSFISSNNTFDREKFDEDMVRLQAWYYDQGYLAMAVGSARVELTADREFIDITIPVDEGPRFRIGEITVRELDANGEAIETLRPASEMREEIDLDRGDWFNRTSIANGLMEIQREYRDVGYARVEVEPETDLDEDERIVDLTLTINRGPLVRIERIVIAGNTKTRDRVIRREFQILEGDLYSQTLIERSRTFINALGYFERVDFSEEEGSSPELMVLNVEVAERATGTFQVGAGFSSIERFIITAQIQQQNLFGRGQSLSLQVQLSGIRQQFQLNFVEPWFLDSRWTLGVNAFYTVQQRLSFNQASTGGGLTLGHPVLDPRLRFFVNYGLEHVAITARTGGFFGNTNATGFNQFQDLGLFGQFRDGITSSIRLSLTWDSRDNRQFASNGVYWNWSTEVADRFLGSDNVFVRHTAFARFYKNIFGPFVLKLNLEWGLITSRDADGVPLFERFYLGGIFNVRGYRLFSLGPRAGILDNPNGSPASSRGADGRVVGGNMQAFYQLELEFPIVESVGIRGVIFTDGGNAWNLESRLCEAPSVSNDVTSDLCGFNPAIRTSWGFGFRWFSPLGPLRFEWGVPINRRPWESKIDFQFNIGNSF